MGKIVLLLIAGFIGWLLVKGLLKQRGDGAGPSGGVRGGTTSDGKTARPPAAAEKMLKCTVCGVFLPESDTMSRDGAVSCRQPERCPQRQRG